VRADLEESGALEPKRDIERRAAVVTLLDAWTGHLGIMVVEVAHTLDGQLLNRCSAQVPLKPSRVMTGLASSSKMSMTNVRANRSAKDI